MNGRCDIVDFLSFYNFDGCRVCRKCYIRDACFLMYIGSEYEDITIYSEGE